MGGIIVNCIPFWVLESNKQVYEIPLGCELGSYLWVEASLATFVTILPFRMSLENI